MGKQLSNLDFGQNQIQNALLHPTSSAPSSPKPGQVYYSTSANVLYGWNGTAWRPLDAAALTDGSIPNTALTTNPLNRANHTGTQTSTTISDFATAVTATKLSAFAAPIANIPMAGYTLTGLPSPTAAGQAAEYSWTLGQIQSAAAGISSKPAVQGVYTSNVALSGLTSTSDGFTPTAGQRMLVAGNTTASQNGPYIVGSGAWTRATTDSQDELDVGATWLVLNGSTYAGTQFRMSNPSTPTLGTTAITIVQFGAGNSYTAGNGLSLTGSVFAANPVAGGGILAGASGLSVDTTIVARKFSTTITGDGTTTSFTITHNLGTQDVVFMLRDSTQAEAGIDYTSTTANTGTIAFGQAPASGATFRATVIG